MIYIDWDMRMIAVPERLAEAAEWSDQEIEKVEAGMDKLEETVRQTCAYWQGQGSEHYRKETAVLMEAVKEMIKPVKKQPVALLKISGVYKEREAENTEIAGSLPVDILK